jgi:hypothetical protein
MAAIDDAVSKHLKSGGMKTREDLPITTSKGRTGLPLDL